MVETVNYSIKEAAKRIGISRSSLYREIKDGRLPTIKIVGRRLVHADDIAAYVASHRVIAPAP